MFIVPELNQIAGAVRKCGTQVELYTPRSIRSSERPEEGWDVLVYKQVTPNGVKTNGPNLDQKASSYTLVVICG
jgi:hypothetical protein